jgi:hypothetical protein
MKVFIDEVRALEKYKLAIDPILKGPFLTQNGPF